TASFDKAAVQALRSQRLHGLFFLWAPAATRRIMTDTMNTYEPAPPPATQPERVSAWEYALAAVVLAACLLAGLALADTRAPAPAVGVLRFASEINFQSASQLVDLLEAARRDDGLAAVVLEVSSPGGFATSSESIFYALLSLREAKPLV